MALRDYLLANFRTPCERRALTAAAVRPIFERMEKAKRLKNLKPKPKIGPAIPPAEFRHRLRELDVSYAWLARKLGKAPHTVSRWADGRIPVPQYAVFALELLEQIKGAEKNLHVA